MKRKSKIFVTKEEKNQAAINNPVIKNRVEDLWLKAYDNYYRKQFKRRR